MVLVVHSEVLHLDISEFVDLLVNVGDLGGKLPDVSDANDLDFGDSWVNSERGPNGEGTGLTRSILALGNQVVMHTVLGSGHCDERDSHTLDP